MLNAVKMKKKTFEKFKNFLIKNVALGQKLRMGVRSWSYTPLVLVIFTINGKISFFYLIRCQAFVIKL